jgi:hypothetical protein
MRDIDPDQEFNYYRSYNTNNYVKYQRGYPGYSDPSSPNKVVICAAGIHDYAFFMAMGTVNPNAIGNHFNDDTFVINIANAYDNQFWINYGNFFF